MQGIADTAFDDMSRLKSFSVSVENSYGNHFTGC